MLRKECYKTDIRETIWRKVEEFLQTRKSCMESNKKGYVARCGGEQSCCPAPWVSNEECRARDGDVTRSQSIQSPLVSTWWSKPSNAIVDGNAAYSFFEEMLCKCWASCYIGYDK